MFERISRLAEQALRDEPPSREDALWVLDGEDVALLPLLHAAFLPRERHFGRKVMIHILDNIQNGLCPEDCGYCSQSSDSTAAIRKYPIKSDAEIFAAAERAAQAGASRYCMVLSGRGPTLERTRKLAGLVREIKARWPIEVCVSAGLLEEEPYRRGHRVRILQEAIAPLAADMPPAVCDRLHHALAVIYGIEPWVVLKDICGLPDREVERAALWMADAMIDAALRDSQAAQRRPRAIKTIGGR